LQMPLLQLQHAKQAVGRQAGEGCKVRGRSQPSFGSKKAKGGRQIPPRRWCLKSSARAACMGVKVGGVQSFVVVGSLAAALHCSSGVVNRPRNCRSLCRVRGATTISLNLHF
jgi:hypothetical protein